MAQYPDIISHTFKTLELTTVLTYLFRLTHQLSSSDDVLRVVGAAEGRDVTVARAALYDAARQVINNGMVVLGLSPVERQEYPDVVRFLQMLTCSMCRMWIQFSYIL